jgi:type II secretory pathway component PulL
MHNLFSGYRVAGFSLAILVPLALCSGPAAAQGTQQQRLACEADAQRLCSQFIPDVDRITSCLMANQRHLSADCRREIGSARKPRTPG